MQYSCVREAVEFDLNEIDERTSQLALGAMTR
jgi:hypothetical protein